MPRRAARLHCVVVSLAVASSLAAAPSEPPACPPDTRERVAEARRLGERAQASFDGGAFVDAAEGYTRAVAAYPECDAQHLRRLTALEQAVATYRELHGGKSERVGFLEKALALVDGYLTELRQTYGDATSELEGFAHAAALRVDLDAAIAAARPSTPEPAPEPAPPSPGPSPAKPDDTRPLKIGVGISAGLAGVALVAGLATSIAIRRRGPLWTDIWERAIFVGAPSGDDDHLCAGPTDPDLRDLCARRTGLVIGAVVSSVLFLAGTSTAIALGVRLEQRSRHSSQRARLTPFVAPGRATTLLGGSISF